jgi:hypothetical protein
MPKGVATVSAVIGVLCFLSGIALGQADLHYSLETERRDATAHFTEGLTVAIYRMNGSPDRLNYGRGAGIHGVLGPRRKFQYESLNCDISRKDLNAFFAGLDALTLGDLPPDEAEHTKSPHAFGWLDWKGEQKYFRTPPDSAKRRKLEDTLLTFVASQRNKRPKEFQTRTTIVVGDDVKPLEIALKDLLRDAKSYNGRRVRVLGYYHNEFEGSSFSVSKEASDRRDYSQSVWLGGPSTFAKPEDTDYRNDAFLTVEGVFSAGLGGHMGLWPGEIRRVTKATAK